MVTLYISKSKLDELASWRPDHTGLVAILAAARSKVDNSAHITAFSVSMNCSLSEKAMAYSAMQNLCNLWPDTILIPIFESYKHAERRADEIYEKNYRHVLSLGSKILYDIRSIIPSGEPIIILKPKDSKKFRIDLQINKHLEENFRARLENIKRLDATGHGAYIRFASVTQRR